MLSMPLKDGKGWDDSVYLALPLLYDNGVNARLDAGQIRDFLHLHRSIETGPTEADSGLSGQALGQTACWEMNDHFLLDLVSDTQREKAETKAITGSAALLWQDLQDLLAYTDLIIIYEMKERATHHPRRLTTESGSE